MVYLPFLVRLPIMVRLSIMVHIPIMVRPLRLLRLLRLLRATKARGSPAGKMAEYRAPPGRRGQVQTYKRCPIETHKERSFLLNTPRRATLLKAQPSGNPRRTSGSQTSGINGSNLSPKPNSNQRSHLSPPESHGSQTKGDQCTPNNSEDSNVLALRLLNLTFLETRDFLTLQARGRRGMIFR
jgi:hypothetical protein